MFIGKTTPCFCCLHITSLAILCWQPPCC